MSVLSHTEEDYLKVVFNITERNKGTAGTNDIAGTLNTTPASVTDMIKRLSDKGYLNYKKYHGVQLSPMGIRAATQLIRNERLWKVFLHNSLGLSWDRIAYVAEQLKHVRSEETIDALSQFLGNPKFDPLGEAIPNKDGRFTLRNQVSLFNMKLNERGVIVGVRRHDAAFLKFLSTQNLKLGTKLKVINTLDFDFSKEVLVNDDNRLLLAANVCQELYVKPEQ